MVKLEEKAKTLEQLEEITRQLHDELTWGKQKPFQNVRTALSHQESNQKSAEYHSDLWVRLEDAHQIEEELNARIEIGKDSAVLITKLGREIEALKGERGELKQKVDKVKLWIFGLYKEADHLSHEDERQSCAYLLRDLFGVETEEGRFGELFLTDKAKTLLEE